MDGKIEGKEYSISKVFSSEFDFVIPSYQRPYAWGKEQTLELLDDLYEFFGDNKEEYYFLGSIVLIKDVHDPFSEVIDGQQRLTTLVILLSVISSLLEDNRIQKDYEEYLREPGRPSQNLQPKPRLTLRERDKDFFENYIQEPKIQQLEKIDPTGLEEPQKRIRENAILIKDELEKYFKNDQKTLQKFGSDIVSRCFLVIVSTPSRDSAFRIFSVLNSRGLDLLPIDIIKADVIGNISKEEQEKYTSKWEETEIELGRDKYNDLLGHIRMIFTRKKAKKTLMEEFKEFVLNEYESKELMDNILLPYSEQFDIITKSDYAAVVLSEEINEYLYWLNIINFSDWIPPTLVFFVENSDNPKLIYQFVKKMEKLSTYLHITGKDINKRIERFSRILQEIDYNNHNLPKSIELDINENNEMIEVLNGDVYLLTSPRRRYIMLRLDSFVSDGSAKYDNRVFSLEHVLPRTMTDYWDELWSEDDHIFWLNKIGNLVPLSRRKNSSAQNYDFSKKKEKYFMGKSKTSAYQLTTQVIGISEWTPDVVQNRQKKLIKIVKYNWDLD